MKRHIVTAFTVLALAATLGAQRQRVSPHEQVSATISGAKITIDYGRPYLKGRKAVGGTLAPYGQVWRTGADEATVLTTSKDLMLGSLHVPAGSYALFTLPEEKGWKLIVNKTVKQWGAFKYDAGADLGRVDMKVEKTAQPVEQFTITLDNSTLKMAWENTQVSVPVMVH